LALQSPFTEDVKELRDEAQFLIAELRWPTTTDEEAIARTLRNYPALTEDEIRSWWRVGEFRRQVKESREVAAQYAKEDSSRFVHRLESELTPAELLASRSPWGRR
jgi:hypothetical protein